jgi:hypothetical protein
LLGAETLRAVPEFFHFPPRLQEVVMLGLLTRKTARPAPRLARLGLEALESRDAPSFLSISLNYSSNKSGAVNGRLANTPNPGGQTIVFSGITSGTVTTNANGSFTYPCTFTALGTVFAQGPDSNLAQATLSIAPPVLNSFTAVENQTTFTLSGSVSYSSNFADVTVNFGGCPVTLQNKSTSVDYTGSYSYLWTPNGLASDNGTCWAQAVDVWGQTSSQLLETIHQTGT